MEINALLNAVTAWLTVRVMAELSSSTLSFWFCKARTTASEVSLPSAPMVRSWPMVTPRPRAMAWASAGVCSMIEFSSSPRSVPEASAWPNWTIDASAACALAPLSATVLATVSVTLATSEKSSPSCLAFCAMR
ncbi:hypothetical protein D3C76_839920 [compost metagenome]